MKHTWATKNEANRRRRSRGAARHHEGDVAHRQNASATRNQLRRDGSGVCSVAAAPMRASAVSGLATYSPMCRESPRLRRRPSRALQLRMPAPCTSTQPWSCRTTPLTGTHLRHANAARLARDAPTGRRPGRPRVPCADRAGTVKRDGGDSAGDVGVVLHPDHPPLANWRSLASQDKGRSVGWEGCLWSYCSSWCSGRRAGTTTRCEDPRPTDGGVHRLVPSAAAPLGAHGHKSVAPAFRLATADAVGVSSAGSSGYPTVSSMPVAPSWPCWAPPNPAATVFHGRSPR